MKPVFAIAAALLLSTQAWAGAAATAKMIDLSGKEIGRANFKAATHGVLIELEVHGLSPGAHAVMLHSTASCDPAKQFASAGSGLSFDPARQHGYFAKGGARSGDLPNQFAAADGTLHASFFTTGFSLGNGKKSIFDRDGASIIVHAKADDYVSQPDGRAGARVACGTIMRTVGPGSRKFRKHR
jgi:superoxide dismutase, Cu-Zn family